MAYLLTILKKILQYLASVKNSGEILSSKEIVNWMCRRLDK